MQFPKTPGGNKLEAAYKANRRTPKSLAITIINKFGTHPGNTGVGSLIPKDIVDSVRKTAGQAVEQAEEATGNVFPEEVKETFREGVDSLLPESLGGNPEPSEMYSGGQPDFTDTKDWSSPLLAPNRDPFEPGSPYSSQLGGPSLLDDLEYGHLGEKPHNSTDPLSLLPTDPSTLPDATPVIANAVPEAEGGWFKDAEGELTDAGASAVKAGTNILTTVLSDAIRDDPEPPQPVYRAPTFRAQPKQTQFSGIGAQQAATGGTVLGRQLFLGGGEVDGPGGPKEDVVPIWASDQEYVVSADGVKRLGGGSHRRGIQTLDRINFGKS
jgi:hypothetical protein